MNADELTVPEKGVFKWQRCKPTFNLRRTLLRGFIGFSKNIIPISLSAILFTVVGLGIIYLFNLHGKIFGRGVNEIDESIEIVRTVSILVYYLVAAVVFHTFCLNLSFRFFQAHQPKH